MSRSGNEIRPLKFSFGELVGLVPARRFILERALRHKILWRGKWVWWYDEQMFEVIVRPKGEVAVLSLRTNPDRTQPPYRNLNPLPKHFAAASRIQRGIATPNDQEMLVKFLTEPTA